MSDTPLPTAPGGPAVEIGIEGDRVVMIVGEPPLQIRMTGAHAMEIAVSLMKHARRIGTTQPVVWRVGRDQPSSFQGLYTPLHGGPQHPAGASPAELPDMRTLLPPTL